MSSRNKYLLIRGFTLLELLLSISLVAVISVAGVPIYASLQTRSDLKTATQIVTQAARRAETRAWANEGDSSWGFYVNSGQAVVYKGVSYAARDTSYDEIYTISDSIVITGDSEYLFSQVTGLPDAAGSVTLTSLDSATSTINVGANGQIY